MKPKKCYYHDDIKYEGIILSGLSHEEDYDKPIITSDAVNSNYVESEIKVDKDKTLSIIKYLNIIIPYLSKIIKEHKTQEEWKIQLTIAINFKSSKDYNESRNIRTKSGKIEIMMRSETGEII